MAWNEPGGNGKQRDPWGGDQGPPDLDEAFRKFRQKLGAAFGSGSGGGSGEDKALNRAIAGLIVLVLASLWLYAGINVLDAQERAVVLRFGRFHEVLEPGFNWNPKWVDQVFPVNVTAERQYNSTGVMLTQDENIVELPIAVQYNIADIKAFVLNVNNPENSLQQATDSALRHVVGSSKLDQVLSEGRGQIGDDVRFKLQSYLDNYGTGIQVVKVTIQGAKPPGEVKAAFDDVIKAKEDEERLKNEASAYAFSVVPEARGRAQRVFEEAAAYRGKVVAEAQGEAQRFEKLLGQYEKAPEVTRERLYLDAVQRVMSNSSKVLVDVPGSNNVMYLPIDRLGRQQPEAAPPVVRSPQVENDDAARDALDRARRDPGNLRQRERR
ncbi:MAG: FtsH protease activity modulator HflK [Gammaproteobacteria bacterium]|jgi:membrane protease subunit HflK|nr:FtsH protease activity modulator HflK [Gammaproteobacteria bacterium]MBP6053178.1 FtsH protease activity modulator HflK [Pseudomonadales bacterium]MBK6582685.1 FtsH protease activity modulator HflK [Gammaproteobacteria bacterium]MBK7518815.1 FtsH protease activity modulator HflK [Gammaproteobacteria bacterium]MBK7730439.1 FtsH protease activity modulator HflK [Gammaproteobacteria bacterium]